ncbi:hypothetical protein PCASD_15749 [Puccinia coronata f. sp. avenae]|uniref:Uncharacterized protein n=1 Tax=Puccinia coronata f. sp. avenae TaxID=200324 RepID=A0A2N5U7F1_9BASI|nr:hypothetical protein PCASD_15749 [Puccinia coronata f. sp. avenae]
MTSTALLLHLPREIHPHTRQWEDGKVFRHDLRTPDQPNNAPLLEARAQYTDLCWNPVSPDLFLASTNHTIRLYDRRKLGSNPTANLQSCLVSTLLAIALSHELRFIRPHQYTTNLMKPKPLFRIGHPEISSVTIDPTGQLLGAMMSKWYPTIWSLDDPHPLAVLKSEPTVDGDAQTQGGSATCVPSNMVDSPIMSIPISPTLRGGAMTSGATDGRYFGRRNGKSEMRNQKRVGLARRSHGGHLRFTDTGDSELGTIPPVPTTGMYVGVEKLVKVHSARRVGWYAHQSTDSRAQMTSTTVRATMSMADRIPFIFGPSHRAQQYSAARPEDEDLETLAMFDALLEREKDDHQALWYGLDPSREDDPRRGRGGGGGAAGARLLLIRRRL